MGIKKYLRRKRKRVMETGAAGHSFFKSESLEAEGKEEKSFFPPAMEKIQTNLKVSSPDDKQEIEANRMADKVISKKGEPPVKADEEEIHRASKEDELHKKEKQEEIKRKEIEEEKDKPVIATKLHATPKGTSTTISNTLKSKTANGQPMTSHTLHEMSSRFGYDFSNVKIHTGAEAEAMNEQLNAKAFAFGKDLYFNKQQYNLDTDSGKWLLAHELTHVVQQKKSELQLLQRKKIPGISTPLPKNFEVKEKKKQVLYATGKINGVVVIIKPDTTGPLADGRSGETKISFEFKLPGYNHEKGIITKVNGDPVVTFNIRTTYLPATKITAPSAYGKGTSTEDKTAGNTSLEFHEGSHGTTAMEYIAHNALPLFYGKTGMTIKAYQGAETAFKEQLTLYYQQLQKANIEQVDCSGKAASFCTP